MMAFGIFGGKGPVWYRSARWSHVEAARLSCESSGSLAAPPRFTRVANGFHWPPVCVAALMASSEPAFTIAVLPLQHRLACFLLLCVALVAGRSIATTATASPARIIDEVECPDCREPVSPPYLPANANVTLRLRTRLQPVEVAFTTDSDPPGGICDTSRLVHPAAVRRLNGSQLLVALPPLNASSFYYVCANADNGRPPIQWVHQGAAVRFGVLAARGRGPPDGRTATIFGIRAEGDRVSVAEDGATVIPADVEVRLRLFGLDLTVGTTIIFTPEAGSRDSSCDDMINTAVVRLSEESVSSENVAWLDVSLPISSSGSYYMCVKRNPTSNADSGFQWVHQGDGPWVRVEAQGRLLPLWLQCMMIGFLLLLSGLFSGLNLGLMALDKTELQVIESCGTEREKKYAKSISPLRHRGNYLLCSLLLGNVLVNSTLTILLDDLTSGIVAIIVSTMSIVLFGEIIPQAICSRHGLAVGAQTVYITKFFMIITFPLSYPISLILDHVLGEEIGNVYDRERLMEFIRVTKDYNKLANEQVNIISGALELKNKTVSQVMTRIEDVFMVPYEAVLDFETVSEIMKQGYTRIPVYDGDRNNVVALLHAKDLAFVDPDDNTPLKTLIEFYNHPVNFVFEDETLDVMLNEFKTGRSHMAFVRHINTEGDGDPFYEISGVITLEDVIEEIIQSEIIDETDVLTDNRKKQRRKEAQVKQDFSDFAKIGGGQQGQNVISPQLALATFQYLSTSVDPFKKEILSETVVRRLMAQNIFFTLKLRSKDDCNAPAMTLYQAGKPADYFVLILEGRVRVTVGKENLVFEAGPFTYFGMPAISLTKASVDGAASTHSISRSSNQSLSVTSPVEAPSSKYTFVPDYTVVAVADTLFMKVPRAVYLAAYRASLMERQQRTDDEWEGEAGHPRDLPLPSAASNTSLAQHPADVHSSPSERPDSTFPRHRPHHKQRHSIGTPRERSAARAPDALHPPSRKDANGDLSPNRLPPTPPIPNNVPPGGAKLRSVSQLEMRDLGPSGDGPREDERTRLLHEKGTS